MQHPISQPSLNSIPWGNSSWQQQLNHCIKDPAELWQYLALDESLLPQAYLVQQKFSLRVPWNYVKKIKQGDLKDPLLRQILPAPEELIHREGFTTDPLDELSQIATTGLIQKYKGRALLLTTSVCGIHCRYCFRRHFPYPSQKVIGQQWQEILSFLKKNKNIEEIILSGGDPLSLTTAYLAKYLQPIIQLPQIKRLRFHSRFPVIIPERINQKLLDWLASLPLKVVFILHINHAHEIDEKLKLAVKLLLKNQILVLNQSVLLRGVNDTLISQIKLNKTLFHSGILPYYLHLLDPVAGASHFFVPENEANQLHQQLTAQLSGYLVPRLVKEQSGLPFKKPLYPTNELASL